MRVLVGGIDYYEAPKCSKQCENDGTPLADGTQNCSCNINSNPICKIKDQDGNITDDADCSNVKAWNCGGFAEDYGITAEQVGYICTKNGATIDCASVGKGECKPSSGSGSSDGSSGGSTCNECHSGFH